MDQNRIYVFLAWITIAMARPQESEDTKLQCSAFYTGKDIPRLNDEIKERFQIDSKTENRWKTKHLTYK